MNTLMRAFSRFCRITRTLGFGIQSPFAYNFVTKLVHDKTDYEIYQALLQRYPTDDRVRLKLRQLVWRVCRWRVPKEIAVALEEGKDYEAYCREGAVTSSIINYADFEECLRMPPANLLLVKASSTAFPLFEHFANHATASSILFVLDIYQSSHSVACWKRMVADNRSRVSFDLWDCGIIFFDPKYYKAYYKINL